MRKKVSFFIYLTIMFPIVLLFQNCGSNYQSNQSPSSVAGGSSSTVPQLKTDTHQCSFNSYDEANPYYIRQDPFNPQKTLLYYSGRPMYGVPTQNAVQTGARLITPNAIYCGSQLVVELDSDEMVETLSPSVLLLHKTRKVISNCGTFNELDYDLVQRNRNMIPQMNYEQVRSKYSIYKGAIVSSRYQDLGNGYNISDGQVYWQSSLVMGADRATFQPLNVIKFSMAQDNQFTYFNANKVNAPVVGTPSPVSPIIADQFYVGADNRWTDNQSVFYQSTRLGTRAGFVNLARDWSLVDGGVFYLDRKLTSVDLASFKVVPNSMFAYDKNNLFYGEKVVRLPQGLFWNPQSLSVLGERIFFNNYLVLSDTKLVLMTSQKDFRCIGTGLVTDGTKLVDNQGVDVTAQFAGADLKNFYNLSSGLGYFDKRNYYTTTGTSIAISNPATFLPLNRYYFSADGKVFNGNGIALPGADTNYVWQNNDMVATTSQIYIRGNTSFAFNSTLRPKYLGSGYYLGDNQAHYSGLRTINNVDVSTFRILSNTIAYDKNFIYSAGLQAVANNGGNLRALFNGTWALDENVYRGTTLIPGVLASSFYSYNPNNAFFVSGNSVYYSSQNITNDFTNFKSLGGQYWQDSMKVGHASQVLPALRPNTVTVVGPHMTLLDGGGNNGVYYYGVGVAGALGGGNVQYLGGYFGGYSSTFWTDMRTVFATRNPVAGVRPDQIYFLPNGTATDGTRCYASDAAVIACPP